MSDEEVTPVIEIGGSHVVMATTLGSGANLRIGSLLRRDIDSGSGARDIIAQIAAAANSVNVPRRLDWAAAIPGPFDYVNGVGEFASVGKFEALRGVSVRDELLGALSSEPASIRFINDADAFGLGEARVGLASGHKRSISVTVGTGIGSAFVEDGEAVTTGARVPPQGHAHLWNYAGAPLEETISSRALTREYLRATGLTCDVREILNRVRQGDTVALTVAERSFVALGESIGAWVELFDASAVIVGGSMVGSWDVIEEPIGRGIASILGTNWHRSLSLIPTEDTIEAAVLGAASWLQAQHTSTFSVDPSLN